MRRAWRAALWLAACAALPAEAVLGSKSGVTPPTRSHLPTVWLYTSVACDYDGAVLLPHFLDHYVHKLGIDARRLLVVANHNPGNEDAEQVKRGKANLERVKDLLASYGASEPTLWLGQYSSEELYQYRLQLMERTGLDDWIVHADSDEFHEYAGLAALRAKHKDAALPLAAYFAAVAKRGVNFVAGEYVDRVAEGGELAPLRSSPPIDQQFPLRCNVIRELVESRNVKAMAYTGAWRSDRGNHQVVKPARARGYFGPSDESEKGARGVFGQKDYYPLTPYERFPKRYQYACTQDYADKRMPLPGGMGHCGDKAHPPGSTSGAKDGLVPKGLDKAEAGGCKVHHFKWHERVKNSIRDRLKHYGGGASGGDAAPKYDWYKDSQKLMDEVVSTGRIDVRKAKCDDGGKRGRR